MFKMWNKKLLRTKRTLQSSDGSASGGLLKAVAVALLLIVQIGAYGVVEARSYLNEKSSDVPVQRNNEMESATTMIEFRDLLLQRIVPSPRDASLTLLQLKSGSSSSINNLDVVQGLQFHAVHHPLLCDEDLATGKSRVNVQIVEPSEEEEEVEEAVVDQNERNVKYLCAVWPVVVGASGASQLEWLSANGIERRSAGTWSTGTGDDKLQYLLVMHLGGQDGGAKINDLKRYVRRREKRIFGRHSVAVIELNRVAVYE